MDAVEKTLTYRDDTVLYGKRLPKDKVKHPPKTEPDEPNYVDLVDMKSEGTKSVQVTYPGEGDQRDVTKRERSALESNDRPNEGCDCKVNSEDFPEEHLQDKWFDMTVTGELAEQTRLTGKGPETNMDTARNALLQKEHDACCGNESICSTSDDMEYTDMYLNSKTESDHDDESEVLSDHCESDRVEDESHYITTHEIQLTELDHDVDYDLGRGDCEDDNLVYTFVDYALFESDETPGDSGKGKKNKTLLNIAHEYKGAAAADAEPESDSDNSSDESVFKNEGVNTHQERLIHLSIKPAPRTEDSSDNFSANGNVCGQVRSAQYRGRFLTNINPRRCDFIPPPGRQHLATKLRWKDVNSSGASSSISELDDADKEVRNLTSKTFRSLACPYFDAINLSTSSESSMSEYGLGLNKWSAYVNLNHGNISQQTDRGVFAHKSSSATFALSNAADSKSKETAQTKMYAANKNEAHSKHASSSSNTMQTEQPQWGDVITLTETINFHVEAELPESRRPSKCSHGLSRTKEGAAKGNTQKRATFASSHLKNVISKKMQFENERQLERRDFSSRSPCLQCREQEHSQGRGVHRQSSESGSEFTVNSLDEIGYEGVMPHSCETKEDMQNTKSLDNTPFPERGCIEKPDLVEPLKARLNHSQCSAFTLLKGEAGPQGGRDTSSITATTDKEVPEGSGVVNKLSHLFVPSSLLLTKEKDLEEQDLSGAVTHSGREPGGAEDAERVAKPPEIKIRLRTAKENKGHMLNIANLLTPKISNTVKTLKTAGYSRLQVLSAPDRMPHFTVRDVRENKCKFQAPIYHVRDVRKLVKSSYSFVSADNGDNRCPTSAAEVCEDTSKRDSIKHVSPSPIFIKCNSVKTNSSGKPPPAATEPSQPKPPEASGFSPRGESSSSHWSAYKGPPTGAKQPHLDLQRQDRQTGDTGERKNDPKVPNQAALEKLQAAVKTMEQLYVFDRNEWKRKGHAPQPVSNSHVLSLIASEEHGAEEIGGRRSGDPDAVPGGRATAQTFASPSVFKTGRDKEGKAVVYVPVNRDPVGARPQPSRTYCKKSVLHLDNSQKAPVSVHPQNRELPPSAPSEACTLKSTKTPGGPQLLKVAPPKDGGLVEQVKAADSGPMTAAVTPSNADHGNYLTIPRQGYTSEIRLLHPPNAKGDSTAAKPEMGPAPGPEGPPTYPPVPQNQPAHTECPSATIFHHRHQHHPPALPPQAPPQPHLLRLSPSASPLCPSPGAEPPAPQTQRKMLLDLSTGFYYLVDTPLRPATKRLFDPETGRYVDVPVSHSPVTPIPLSPLTLSPGAYTPTYMMYPGLIPPSSTHADTPRLPEAGDRSGPLIPPPSSSSSSHVKQRQEAGVAGSESPYYSATGEAAHAHAPARMHVPTLQLPGVAAGRVTGRSGDAAGAERKPVISITTPQGPRIIAPPSFDGTTMSFVVEHR